MPWLIVILGYFLGSIPTAYIAGHMVRGIDIRQAGDENMGAANAYRQLGAKVGIAVGIIDAGKGALAILIAQAASIPQPMVLITGAAAVIGHNWPVFIGFRGGRGVSTSIGVLLAQLIRKNVSLACAFLFISLPLVCWWLGCRGYLLVILLPYLV